MRSAMNKVPFNMVATNQPVSRIVCPGNRQAYATLYRHSKETYKDFDFVDY